MQASRLLDNAGGTPAPQGANQSTYRDAVPTRPIWANSFIPSILPPSIPGLETCRFGMSSGCPSFWRAPPPPHFSGDGGFLAFGRLALVARDDGTGNWAVANRRRKRGGPVHLPGADRADDRSGVDRGGRLSDLAAISPGVGRRRHVCLDGPGRPRLASDLLLARQRDALETRSSLHLEDSMAHNNLATFLASRGRTDEAVCTTGRHWKSSRPTPTPTITSATP